MKIDVIKGLTAWHLKEKSKGKLVYKIKWLDEDNRKIQTFIQKYHDTEWYNELKTTGILSGIWTKLISEMCMAFALAESDCWIKTKNKKMYFLGE